MYKALVIGCGNIGALYDLSNDQVLTHAKALHLDGRFSLSVFDINKALARAIADKYNCEMVEELNEENLSLFDCISICTPTNTHTQFIKQAIDSKVKVIICEKPVSNDHEELAGILTTYSRATSKIIINYIRRFQPAFIELKATVSTVIKSEMVTNICIRYHRGFINNCSHAFDTIEYLTSSEMELNDVKIHNRTFDHFEDDPTLSLQAMWHSANVSITGLSNVRFSHFEIDIYFEHHKICIKNAGQNITVYKSGHGQVLQPLVIQHHLKRANCLQDYMKHIIDHAHRLLEEKECPDNFFHSVNLNLRMLNYMNN